jgi:hypothetical protein
MKYRVEIVYTIEADWLGEAAEQVQKAIEDGVPRHFALSIRPLDLEGNPGHGIERLVGPVDGSTGAAGGCGEPAGPVHCGEGGVRCPDCRGESD